MSDKNRIIFILGMHRSGTSALARVMSLCGASLPRGLSEPAYDNPTGHWEPLRAKELNEGFLHACASTWDDVRLGIAPDAALADEFVGRICEFLKRDLKGLDDVVLKEPRITALLPYWLAAAAQSGYEAKSIHVFRHPADVATSLSVRDGLAFDHSCALWRKYNLLGERDARDIPHAFVSYESLVQNWGREIERCCAEIGVAADLGPEPRRHVEAFLSPDLHHHRDGSVDATTAGSEEWQQTLAAYGAFRRMTEGAPETAFLDALFAEHASRPQRPFGESALVRR
jgi:hypothetical protein